MLVVVLIIVAAKAILLTALYAKWRAAYRYPPAGMPQILCYHKITSKFCLEGTWTTPRRFLNQIDFLMGQGYKFIGEEEFLKSLDSKVPGGEKALLLTFDDGYRETLAIALPLLEERKIPALVFMVPGFAGKRNQWELSLGRRSFFHLSWKEAEELGKRDVSFGSHGLTHSDLTRLGSQKLREELVKSKLTLEDKLGREIRSLSYPFGRYDSNVKAMAREAGYKAAFSLYPSHANDVIDRYALRRNSVYIIDSHRTVTRKLGAGSFFWFEEMKCRAINGVAILTPIIKSLDSHRGR